MGPKKNKFTDIKVEDCKSPLMPGRSKCECQAVKHPLVNNCLSCGRIVCIQEGAGPCFFCGEPVMTKEERAKLQEDSNSKQALKAKQAVLTKYERMTAKQASELALEKIKQEAAIERRNRLVEYDKTVEKRTKVIDDQSDYFASDSVWLGEEERKLIKQKEQAYRDMKDRVKRKMKVTIDFAGRRIIEEQPEVDNIDQMLQALNLSKLKNKADDRMLFPEESDKNSSKLEPKYVGNLEKKTDDKALSIWSNRIQDTELQEMVDAGNCLSIQQPWASLIIDGIKRFEGRNWYTPIRGRLYILSGAKQPTIETIENAKRAYKFIMGDVEFPRNLPLGSLIGCVDFIDCIPQEEYQELYPNGEVSDPYVFVFSNPKSLPINLPMQSKAKIFKMDTHIHQSVKKHLLASKSL